MDASTASLPQRTRRQRLQGPLVTGGLVAGLTLALHVHDPHGSGSWGYCPFYAMTGLYCPGCGGLRAVNDLTNGDLLAAASSNLLFVVSIPFLVWAWVRWTRRSWSGAEPATGRARAGVTVTPAIVVLCVVLLVFAVVRNLPMGAWLAP